MKKVLITLKIKNMSKEIVYWKMRNGKLVSVDDMDTNHHLACKVREYHS